MVSLIVGIAWIGAGIACVRERNKENSDMNLNPVWLAFCLFLFGAMGVLGFILDNIYLELASILVSSGLFCIWSALIRVYLKFSCNTVVDGIYLRYNTYYGGKGQSSYAPVFEYVFDGVTYRRQSPVAYGSLKKLQRKYQTGEKYPIYINPGNPKQCIERKSVSPGEVVMLLLGAFFVGIYVVMICI